MKSITHIFFDLDHTLWDFESNSQSALEELYHDFELNKGELDLDEYLLTFKNINSEMWQLYAANKISREEVRELRFQKILEELKLTAVPYKKLSSAYLQISPFQKKLLPNCISALDYLQGKNYELHIITNGFYEVQHLKLNHSGLKKYFKTVTTSECSGYKKPDPKIFEHALKLANCLPEQSVYIGDDHKTDVLGAENAGLKGIYYNPVQAVQSKTTSLEISCLSELKKMF